MAILEPECPPKGGDRRHHASADFAFVEYDNLSEDEGEVTCELANGNVHLK